MTCPRINFKWYDLKNLLIWSVDICDVDPHWSYADPPNLVNVDPDPGQKITKVSKILLIFKSEPKP